MIIAAAILLGLLLGAASGGSPRSLKHARLRGEGYLIGSLVLQALVPLAVVRMGWSAGLLFPVWMASFGVVLLVCLANWRQPGVLAAGIGAGLNLLVIAGNGAMPVSLVAMINAGFGGDPATAFSAAGWSSHVPMTSGTALTVLADIMPTPEVAVAQGVVSMGDVLLVIGVVAFLNHAMTADNQG